MYWFTNWHGGQRSELYIVIGSRGGKHGWDRCGPLTVTFSSSTEFPCFMHLANYDIIPSFYILTRKQLDHTRYGGNVSCADWTCTIRVVRCWMWRTAGGGNRVTVPLRHLRLARLRPAQQCNTMLSPPTITLSSSNLTMIRSQTHAPTPLLQQDSSIWCSSLTENDPRRSAHVKHHHRTN